MNLVIAARSVDANEDTNDLNIYGVFTEALPPALPAYMPLLYLIVFCEAETPEFGQEKLIEIHLFDADRNLQQRWYDVFVVPKARRIGERSFATPIFTLQDVPFPKAGSYEFSITVDKRTENSLPFYVHEPPETNETKEGEV
ncbi:MAG: DUF6941 family protein [Rubrobacteraceae bacterium]